VAGVTAPVRVLIVDDDALVRAGLTMILTGARDIEVVGEVADGAVVASALIDHLDGLPEAEQPAAAEAFVRALRDGGRRSDGVAEASAEHQA
jgi:hypothetical protein